MSDLTEKLREDLDEARNELDRMDDRRKMLTWRIEYIQALLESHQSQEPVTPTPASVSRFLKVTLKKEMTIAEAAVEILGAHGKPMSAMEISRVAMDCGYTEPDANIERVRSHFSAVMSKDLRNAQPRFWQVGRGQIGLAEWKEPIFESDDVVSIVDEDAIDLPDISEFAAEAAMEPVEVKSERRTPPKINS